MGLLGRRLQCGSRSQRVRPETLANCVNNRLNSPTTINAFFLAEEGRLMGGAGRQVAHADAEKPDTADQEPEARS